MKIELDRMVLESGITPYLHTRYSAPYVEDGELKAVIIENRSGRFAIRAKFFIDATADGFLGADMGMEVYYHGDFQPATTGARVAGWEKLTKPNNILRSDENRLRRRDPPPREEANKAAGKSASKEKGKTKSGKAKRKK